MNLMIKTTLLLLALVFFPWGEQLFAMQREVVVYTSVDQIFSEPIFAGFEKEHHIRVKAVYDIEAVKSAGLVNRLLAEKNNPRCDVFWNSEILRTLLLQRKGILKQYSASSARDIPEQFKDRQGYWTGFAGRLRVFVINTDLVEASEYPSSLQDLLLAKWKGKTAMANPLFGTTATHVASIFSTLGSKESRALFTGLAKNKIHIVDGNSVVRDMTGSGEVAIGITDSDDVEVGISAGMPIKAVSISDAGGGSLLIPNTVALIAGGPNPDAGKIFIEYVLSKETVQKLINTGAAQVPLRKGMMSSEKRLVAASDIQNMHHDYQKMSSHLDEAVKTAQQIFIR